MSTTHTSPALWTGREASPSPFSGRTVSRGSRSLTQPKISSIGSWLHFPSCASTSGRTSPRPRPRALCSKLWSRIAKASGSSSLRSGRTSRSAGNATGWTRCGTGSRILHTSGSMSRSSATVAIRWSPSPMGHVVVMSATAATNRNTASEKVSRRVLDRDALARSGATPVSTATTYRTCQSVRHARSVSVERYVNTCVEGAPLANSGAA